MSGYIMYGGAPDATPALVRRLRAAGYSYRAIGDLLGVHWRTVYRWSRGENHPWQAGAVNRMLAQVLAETRK